MNYTIFGRHKSVRWLQVSEAKLPAAASVALPGVQVRARVAEHAGASATGPAGPGAPAAGPGDSHEGVVLRAGRYLAATADIGLFEHTLSTDLLNHLVFVQKVFMKVNYNFKDCSQL